MSTPGYPSFLHTTRKGAQMETHGPLVDLDQPHEPPTTDLDRAGDLIPLPDVAAETALAAEPAANGEPSLVIEAAQTPPPGEVPEGVDGTEPEVTQEPQPAPAAPSRRSWTWLWSSLLGAALGGLLGLLLTLLVFAGINGAIDVRRSSAFRALSSQASGLSVEIDAVRTDVSTLQGDIDGLRQRVEVLSGLTARMDQAESTIETFGSEIDTLQSSVNALTQDVDDLGQAVDTLKVESAQTMSFFEQLRALLEGIFGDKGAN